MNAIKFKGIIPALYTCFNDDGGVNYDETARLACWLVEKGAGGFYLCGTTGSGLLLSLDERRKIVEAVAAAVNGRVPIMVHVGAMATRDAAALAEHATNVPGVCGISSLPPQYYPVSFDEEIRNLSVVAGASGLPFYPYLFENMVQKYGIARLIEGLSQIPNMMGLKVFISDLAVHQAILYKGPSHWQIFHGYDQCLFQALTIPGITAAIGSTYNIVPEIVVAIFDAVDSGDYEKGNHLHRQYCNYWMAIQGHSFLTFGSYFLSKRGFAMGLPRMPLCEPGIDEKQLVETTMRQMGFNVETGGL